MSRPVNVAPSTINQKPSLSLPRTSKEALVSSESVGFSLTSVAINSSSVSPELAESTQRESCSFGNDFARLLRRYYNLNLSDARLRGIDLMPSVLSSFETGVVKTSLSSRIVNPAEWHNIKTSVY